MILSIPVTPPHVSVNRVRLEDLPGLPVDAEVRGQLAYHLLSAEAVARYAVAQAEALDLPPVVTLAAAEVRRTFPRRVEAALCGADATARLAAESIARRLGRNLGYILLTLHRGDAVNRAVRPDWSAADWARWGAIRQVWLGGGMLSGALGERMLTEARALLAELGYADALAVTLTPYRREMALFGAARYFAPTVRVGLCFDFGQTWVKRARFDFAAAGPPQARVLPPTPTDWLFHNDPLAATAYSGEEVLGLVADVLAETFMATDGAAEALILSVAAYVEGGRLLGNGIYARMSALAADVRPLLVEAVRARTGRALPLALIHDGTAAATLHAGAAHTAVIVVGTALGVGFPQADATGLRPVAAL